MPILKVGPYEGFYSAGLRDDVGPEYLTADSTDWQVNPHRKKLVRRKGSAISGDTLSGTTEVAGLLSAKWSARCRQMIEVQSPSMQDGYPSYASLYAEETGPWAQVYVRSTNGPGYNRVLGDNFATDYPAASASSITNFGLKMVPMWSENALTFSRCANEKQRRLWMAGSRRLLQVGDKVFAPGALGTPSWWGQELNDATYTTGKQRLFPSGHIMPLYLPTLTASASAADSATLPWKVGASFYYSVAFVFDDGSVSIPFLPTAAYTQFTIPGTAGQACATITWTNVPKGPYGCVERRLLRSKQSSVGSTAPPSLYDFNVCGQIKNNTSTVYVDTLGSDSSLKTDDTNIRIDHRWPSRARYMFDFDGHIAISGKLRRNPAAIVLCPEKSSAGATSYLNYSDDEAGLLGSSVYGVAVREDQTSGSAVRSLMCRESAHATYEATAPISLSSTRNLQNVIDDLLASIFSTTTTTLASWKGQLAPGSDGNITCDKLALTQCKILVTCTNGSPTVGLQAGQNFTNVIADMIAVASDGGGLVTGTKVNSNNTTTLTLSNNWTRATGNYTFIIGWDFGDIDTAWATNPLPGGNVIKCAPGEMRAYSNAIPVILYFTKTFANQEAVRDQMVEFTGADPGHARYAAQNFYALNFRGVKKSMGRAQGGGHLLNGGVACFTRGIAVWSNIKGGKSGLDVDWFLQTMFEAHGCISPYSITSANGCVLYMTRMGLAVNDGVKEVIISNAIFNPADRTLGEWANEVKKSGAAADGDTDDAWFSVYAQDGLVAVSYRKSANSTKADRVMFYDYSPGVASSGIDAFLQPDGSPYPWSCPFTLPVSQICQVQKSDGTHLYGAIDSNGGTADGRIDEIDVGYQDNGVAVAPVGYHGLIEDTDGLQLLRAVSVKTKHKKNGTGLSLGLARDYTRGVTDSLSLPTSGATAEYKRSAIGLPKIAQAPKDSLEFKISDDGTGSGGAEFRGFYLHVERYEERVTK